MTHHIILGGGVAASHAIEAIRAIDGGSSRISLISSEPAYNRSLLPAWLADRITKQELLSANDAYFAQRRVDRYLGAGAGRINANARTVSIRRGQTLPFDDLLIATGSSPIMPPVPGIDLPGVQSLWTMANVEAALSTAAALPLGEDGTPRRPEVVVLGGGSIGLAVLSAIVARNWKAHVVEAANQLLPHTLNADAAGMVRDWLQQKDVGVHCGTTVQHIKLVGQRKQASFASSLTLEADLVLVAVGRKPNLALAKSAGIRTDQGILVNDQLQTNFPHIYAAGDVAQLSGQRGPGGMVATAMEQGRVAGTNMAGQQMSCSGGVPRKTVDCCGLRCAGLGNWDDPHAEATSARAGSCYCQLLCREDRITGGIVVGPSDSLDNEVATIQDCIAGKLPRAAMKQRLQTNPSDLISQITAKWGGIR